MYLSETTPTPNAMRVLHGKGNRCGCAIGKASFASPPDELLQKKSFSRTSHAYLNTETEQARYFAAHARCCEELRRIYGELRRDFEASWVFLMQITLLSDPLFTDLARLYVSEGKSAEETVILCREYFFDVLLNSEGGEHLLEVSFDIDDLCMHLLSALGSEEFGSFALNEPDGSSPVILICKAPLSSQIATLRSSICGIVAGNDFSVSAGKELATALGIPLIITEDELPESLSEKKVLLDSDRGYLYIDPDLMTLARFADDADRKRTEEKRQKELASRAALTKDGKHVLLLCELSGTKNLCSTAVKGCDGIGRLSSEEFYLESVSFPDEETLFEKYRRAAEVMPTKPIMIRAFRSSSPVRLRSMISQDEGSRHGELYVMYDYALQTQLRAVMRAAVYGSLNFVLPQSGTYSELSSCARMMEDLSTELYEEDREYTPVPLGTVIDTVSSAIMCEKLIGDCDFFIVDKERLRTLLLGDKSSEDEDEDGESVIEDALEALIAHVATTVKSAKKKSILSLGKTVTHDDVVRALEVGFSTLSVDVGLIVKTKKIISDI